LPTISDIKVHLARNIPKNNIAPPALGRTKEIKKPVTQLNKVMKKIFFNLIILPPLADAL
tara:strand:- start:855 stop:1034 length:180 start_codon:yes stop_codon:yes gene_type:complete